LGDLPWKTGSKTDGFVRMGKRAAPGKPGKRADMLACLADINNCGMGAGKYALGTKALKNLKRQVRSHTVQFHTRCGWSSPCVQERNVSGRRRRTRAWARVARAARVTSVRTVTEASEIHRTAATRSSRGPVGHLGTAVVS
jgi:hypothetical protein